MNVQPAMSVAELEELFETSRYRLVRVLEVSSLIPFLRSKSILDQHDEEFIRNPHIHHTSEDQAGQLLDRVCSRGETGMKILLDQIEENYPDVFQEITGRVPRMSSITPARVKTIIKRCKVKPLHPQFQIQVLNELSEAISTKEALAQQLDRKNREQDTEAAKLEELKHRCKKLANKVKKKAEENEKLRDDFDRINLMLREAQERSIGHQKEADRAKQSARLLTFRTVSLEWKVEELQNSFNLEKRHTTHLKKSAKSHQDWAKKHNLEYRTDRLKVEELQRELEKIDNFRRSVDFSDTISDDITLKIKVQLEEAQGRNEGLNVKLQEERERNSELDHDLALLRRERKMERRVMEMNRKHLDMSQKEMEIISTQRAEINQKYGELFEEYSNSVLIASQLQDTINGLRSDLADKTLVMGVLEIDEDQAANISSGIHSRQESSDDEVGEADSDEDNSDNGETQFTHNNSSRLCGSRNGTTQNVGGEGDALHPQSRNRVHRIISKEPLGKKPSLEKMRSLEESFDSVSIHNRESSSSATTGDEDDGSPTLRTKGFPTYKGALASRKSKIDFENEMQTDLDFLDYQSYVRESRTSRPGALDKRRSRSMSRLEDYDFVQPGCYRTF